MKLHPRFHVVQIAESEITAEVWDRMEKHRLTSLEMIRILTSLIQECVKYAIRDERHPENPNKKGDEA